MPGDGPLVHRHVSVRGIRVHVAEAGAGPPLVLQHGFPQDWRSWEAVIPLLAARHRVICPDMRGFGETDAPAWGYDKEGLAQDLLALTAALGVERFALAGHDWGGVVAFLAALRAPDRVTRLVLLNSSHLFWKAGPRFWWNMRGCWYMPLLGAPLLGPALLRGGWFAPAVLRWAHPGLPWDDETREAFLAPLRLQPARAGAARRLYGSFVSRELGEILRGRYRCERLAVPTLILHGAADRAVRPGMLAGFEPYADDMRLELLDGGGHFVCDAEPERVAERIIDFVAGTSTGTPSSSARAAPASATAKEMA